MNDDNSKCEPLLDDDDLDWLPGVVILIALVVFVVGAGIDWFFQWLF